MCWRMQPILGFDQRFFLFSFGDRVASEKRKAFFCVEKPEYDFGFDLLCTIPYFLSA
jgi:hypothetical protein